MKKYRVLQLGLQLGFPVATHGIYTALSVIKQVIEYCIDDVIHMQLYVIYLQLISTSYSHTHSNVANEMPMWHFIHCRQMTYVNTLCNLFTIILQLVWRI
jgi:hypothetical protein